MVGGVFDTGEGRSEMYDIRRQRVSAFQASCRNYFYDYRRRRRPDLCTRSPRANAFVTPMSPRARGRVLDRPARSVRLHRLQRAYAYPAFYDSPDYMYRFRDGALPGI